MMPPFTNTIHELLFALSLGGGLAVIEAILRLRDRRVVIRAGSPEEYEALNQRKGKRQ